MMVASNGSPPENTTNSRPSVGSSFSSEVPGLFAAPRRSEANEEAAPMPTHSEKLTPSDRNTSMAALRMWPWSPTFMKTLMPTGSSRESRMRPRRSAERRCLCAPAPPTEIKKRRGAPHLARRMRSLLSATAFSANSLGKKCPTRRTLEAGTPMASSCCSHLGVCTQLMAGGGTMCTGCAWLSNTRLITRLQPQSSAVIATKVWAATTGVSSGNPRSSGFNCSQNWRMLRLAFASPEVSNSFQIRVKTPVGSSEAARDSRE
mmetsp:Transcript_74214/g.193225  ORF Transcript_74214/g.193225 Transcript_74214/m.193225 type:complete len:261 (+) Transcript_74214:214-996(+)